MPAPQCRDWMRSSQFTSSRCNAAALFLLSLAASLLSAAPETLFLQSPSISRRSVAFVYAGDIWTADRNGGNVRRLTVHPGLENHPIFSPDGAWIAFNGSYDGNGDVYVIPAEGGDPRRLTFHPGRDSVCGWSADGSRVLFISNRASINGRYDQLYTVPVAGGYPTQLPLPLAEEGSFSPDGQSIAYAPFSPIRTWKRYRGGRATPIRLVDLRTGETVEIPREISNDTNPLWVNRTVYFLSDRNHTNNLFAYDLDSRTVRQLTHHEDYDIKSAEAGDGRIIYSQGGRLHIYDPVAETSTPLPLSFQADLPAIRPHYTKAGPYIHGVGLSPDGETALSEIRGDIYTISPGTGRATNLTNTPGVYERFPVWSPDGARIAWFSDRSGEYQLAIHSLNDDAPPLEFPLGPPSFYFAPQWSPDGSKLVYTGTRLTLYYIDIKKREPVLIDTSAYDLASKDLQMSWSPDSRWIAYTRRVENQLRALFLFDVTTGHRHQVTDGQADVMSPVFSRDGKHLFFAASTNTPGRMDLAYTDHDVRWSLYMIQLNAQDASPLETDAVPTGGLVPKSARASRSAVVIDGIEQRILPLPLPPGNFRQLQTTADGDLWYLESKRGQAGTELKRFSQSSRKSTSVLSGISRFEISSTGKKLLYAGAKDDFGIVPLNATAKVGDGRLDLDKLDILVNPRAEWKQMFNDVWRFERDFFYDPKMHGADWAGIREKYGRFLPHLTQREDLNEIFRELVGELVVGHANVRGGDLPSQPNVAVGLLGADFSLHAGYYRLERIYRSLQWNPGLHAPLALPGLRVTAGDYLLAVNGQPVHDTDNIFSFFPKTVGQPTELTINSVPSMSGSWTITVKPIANEAALRQRNWVEQNRQQVARLTGGRVAYIYLPDTSREGYTEFNRYLFSQHNCEAAIIDGRFNGGGEIPDYFITMLQKPVLSHWATRNGLPVTTPTDGLFGPKLMIINEHAGSGGDALPYFFRAAGLGPLVGRRTAGALIGGGAGSPLLMDGGVVGVPQNAIYSRTGEWVVENKGVEPDVDVELTPRSFLEGRDLQLEAAVDLILKLLAESPPSRPPPPVPPLRASHRP